MRLDRIAIFHVIAVDVLSDTLIVDNVMLLSTLPTIVVLPALASLQLNIVPSLLLSACSPLQRRTHNCWCITSQFMGLADS